MDLNHDAVHLFVTEGAKDKETVQRHARNLDLILSNRYDVNKKRADLARAGIILTIQLARTKFLLYSLPENRTLWNIRKESVLFLTKNKVL